MHDTNGHLALVGEGGARAFEVTTIHKRLMLVIQNRMQCACSVAQAGIGTSFQGYDDGQTLNTHQNQFYTHVTKRLPAKGEQALA
jgi:hypothetical protein